MGHEHGHQAETAVEIRQALTALSAKNPSALSALSNAIDAARGGGHGQIQLLEASLRDSATTLAFTNPEAAGILLEMVDLLTKTRTTSTSSTEPR
jgi:hypothetical protein